jgi:hypothetical protein
MIRKLTTILLASGTVLAASIGYAEGSCDDRPGTPTNVTATAVPDVFGMIKVEWSNTADEFVCWDYDVTHNGMQVPQRAGQPPCVEGMKGHRLQNNFSPGSGVLACYRLRARTSAGSGGCVSEIFSNQACARAR